MHENPKTPEQHTPADIAREAFRRLAARRIAPTPEAYREIYVEIAGAKETPGADKILSSFATGLMQHPGDPGVIARQLLQASRSRDWDGCGKHLNALLERHLLPMQRPDAHAPGPEAPAARHPDTPVAPPSSGWQPRMLRDMLVRTLRLALPSLLQEAPQLVAQSEALAEAIDCARTQASLAEAEARLRQFCFRMELEGADLAEKHAILLRMFRLLLENIGELLEDDSWLSGQIAGVRQLLDSPASLEALEEANRALKEVIYKQSMVKHSLAQARTMLKDVMQTVVGRLDTIATSAGGYKERMEIYSGQIGHATNIGQLNSILDRVMDDTRTVHAEALRSREQMAVACGEVRQAESRIQQLESELRQMSDLMREDQLTGSLARRSLDDVLERELARTARRNLPLCVAMLDLDDFNRLVDEHGSNAGDRALVHLVRVVKDALRAMDIIARFSSEEFLVVLPNMPLEDAAQTITRVQRELTGRIFLHDHRRVLMTFSAGVALRMPGENQESLTGRAAAALLKARQAGRNRVVAAE
jgi:diguanylate cyclase